jgi:hypothetical protein
VVDAVTIQKTCVNRNTCLLTVKGIFMCPMLRITGFNDGRVALTKARQF